MQHGGDYDVVVVGGGPAGLSGALWLARYRRRVRVFDAEDPRNAATWAVHGYPGIQDPPPTELRRTMKLQAVDAGAEYEPACVQRIEGGEDRFTLTLDDGRTFGARRVLIATGLRDVVPEIPGLRDFYGGSIWHCPDCDGPSVPGKRLGVIGWGRGVVRFCLYMLTWTDRMTVLTHGRDAELDGEAGAALARWNIPVRTEAIECLEGDRDAQQVRRVVFEGGETLEVDAMFFHVAVGPGSTLPADLDCRADRDGFLQVDSDFATTIPGVYAAGDITPGSRLTVRAAYEGVRAAIAIHRSLIPAERRLG
jgi:thioredoxin reductase